MSGDTETRLTVKEAAAYLKIGDSTIRDAIRAKRLAVHRYGKAIRIQLSDLIAYDDRCRVEAAVAGEAAERRQRIPASVRADAKRLFDL